MWGCLGKSGGAHTPKKRKFLGFIAYLCDNVLKTGGACAPPELGMQLPCFLWKNLLDSNASVSNSFELNFAKLSQISQQKGDFIANVLFIAFSWDNDSV